MRRRHCLSRGGERSAVPSALARVCCAAAILLTLSGSVAQGRLALKRIAFLPFGQMTYGMVVLMDSDQDGLGEITYNGQTAHPTRTWEIAEYRPVDLFELVRADTYVYPEPCSLCLGNFTPFDVADMDRDGRIEVVGEVLVRDSTSGDRIRAICTVEPTATGSLPDSFNWFFGDTAPVVGSRYGYVTDLDQDSLLEIMTMNSQLAGTAIYENVADNRESLVYCQPPYAPRVWGDFDQNGRMDLVIDNYNEEHIFECTGDNQYMEVCTLSTPWTNQDDWFAGQDVDRNGKPEFFVVYFQYIGLKNYLYMFEALAEHQYNCYLIDSITLFAGGTWPVSLCADLDGDSIEEVVWSTRTPVWFLKSTGPHQFERIASWYSDHGPGYDLCLSNAADFNRNGYSEVYISGEGKTSVLEVEAVRVQHPDSGQEFVSGDTCWIRWDTFTPPRCDSVSLFLLSDTVVPQGKWFWRMDTIVTGLPPGDTTYPWVVPDTTVVAAWIVAIAYGPGWQYDRSDEPFSIRPAGVAENKAEGGRMKAEPAAPTVVGDVLLVPQDMTDFGSGESGRVPRLLLLDVSGRRIMELVPGTNDISRLSPGVYFYTMESDAAKLTRKVVLTGRD